MLVEIEGHTVPHFKFPVYAKVELWGLECGGIFRIQTRLLNISYLLHKTRFVKTESVGTVNAQLLVSGWDLSAPFMYICAPASLSRGQSDFQSERTDQLTRISWCNSDIAKGVTWFQKLPYKLWRIFFSLYFSVK